MVEYHDAEWGVPSHDDTHLFEHLSLEGFQAGLSWELVLRKREAMRRTFAGFDMARVAAFGDDTVAELLLEAGIVRNRLKIRSVIANARTALDILKEHGSLDVYLWDLAGGKTVHNRWRRLAEVPASTPDSERISKELMRRGFKFVGPTGVYAFMQSVGMVNDHLVTCPRREALLTKPAQPHRRRYWPAAIFLYLSASAVFPSESSIWTRNCAPTWAYWPVGDASITAANRVSASALWPRL